jgi:hypothetical protein
VPRCRLFKKREGFSIRKFNELREEKKRTDKSNDLWLDSELVLVADCDVVYLAVFAGHDIRGMSDSVPHVPRDHYEDRRLIRQVHRAASVCRAVRTLTS